MAELINVEDIIARYKDENNLDDSDMTLDSHINNVRKLFIEDYKDLHDDENNKFEYEIDDNEMEILMNEFNNSYLNYLDNYLVGVYEIFDRINDIKLPEQRTKEWHIARSKLISASDSAYTIKRGNKFATANYTRTLLQKIGIKFGYFSTSALLHGTIFEIVSQEMYELRNSVKIKEYGCLPHPNETFIGASPDGIVCKIMDSNDLEQKKMLGRMLEIKNPYSRIINNEIKFEYQIQIQVQLQVTGLSVCDFLETKVKYDYETIDEFFEDVYDIESMELEKDSVDYRTIQNPNIPICNLDKNGMEKGFLIYFTKSHEDRDENIGVLYPMTIPYDRYEINDWKNKMIDEYEEKGYSFVRQYYWKVEIYSVKTVKRDDKRWETEIYPALKGFWNDVLAARKLTDKEVQENYKNIEFDPDRDEIKNPETGEIIKRKLQYLTPSAKEKKQKMTYTFSETAGTSVDVNETDKDNEMRNHGKISITQKKFEFKFSW